MNVDDSIDLGSHTDSTMDIAMAMKLAKAI